MAEGLGRERWAHTAMICCLIANANRNPKKGRPFRPEDFNPYVKRRASRKGADDLSLLRSALEGARKEGT